jgi:pimeloyl-ACP methyl ester carboxylesterase
MSLAVQESGPSTAPTVVLLHGVGTTVWMWRRLIADLEDDLHVLAVDLPGHGASAGTPWTSMPATVAAVADVIGARAQGGTGHVVGLSLGGYVATELAVHRADLVDSAVVSGVNVLPFPRPWLMQVAGRLMAPFMTRGPMLRANARALGVADEDVEGYARAARSMAPGTFLRVGGELLHYRVPPGAGASPVHLLAVAGENEQRLIRDSLPLLAGAFPHGRAALAPGVGHAWNGEAPELFAAVVRAQVTGGPLPEELREAAPARG